MVMSEQISSKGVKVLAKKVKNPDDAAELIKKMDKMIMGKKNNVLIIAYEQGKIFKEFKTNKFTSAVSAFKISMTLMNFKIDIVKFIDMYSKMQTSCISLYYLKNNFRIIKEVCQEHANEFQYFPDKHFGYFKVKRKDCFWFIVKQRCNF